MIKFRERQTELHLGWSMSEDIPEELREFLRSYISSVAHLDILFLLFKDPEASWSTDQISRELRTNLFVAERRLTELAAKGLVDMDPEKGGRCCRDSTVLAQITKLQAFYSLRPAIVIEFIYTQPLDQIRAFADAFKLKKD